MTDELPKPKRNRRRWIIAGVLLCFAAAIGTLFTPDDVVERSRRIKVGDSREKVISVMGGPGIVQGNRSWYRKWPYIVYWVATRGVVALGKGGFFYSHDVYIRYDADGRVEAISRVEF